VEYTLSHHYVPRDQQQSSLSFRQVKKSPSPETTERIDRRQYAKTTCTDAAANPSDSSDEGKFMKFINVGKVPVVELNYPGLHTDI
jgi:hypothetical protein